MAEALRPLSFTLHGSRLIEASAGTGKTWTIAALYLRLITGHGEDAGFGRPLLPSEILVMTFTRAATRELLGRIRERLLQAAACLRGEPGHPSPDEFLQAFAASFAAGLAREQAAYRLASAATAMDDAAVHTIDAWCQRVLREHAFDSGCPFVEELAAQTLTLEQTAARDYWRQEVQGLSERAFTWVQGLWADPLTLQKEVQRLLTTGLPLPPAPPGRLADVLAGPLQQRQEQVDALKKAWAPRIPAWRDWFEQHHGQFNGNKLRKTSWPQWLNHLADWVADAKRDVPDWKAMGDTALRVLTPAGMQQALKPTSRLACPDHFEAFEQLKATLDALPDPRQTVRAHAASHLATRLAELKREAGLFGFADLQQRLDEALDETRSGAAAARLRERVLQQYPVALIDEFQDTSPVQLRIFDRLYRIGHNEPERGIFLIGDPKQAIYEFRGADIYSYLRARQLTSGRHHVLDTNRRSTKAMVEAVNGLFGQAERQAPQGAFGFGTDGAQAVSLPFQSVQPHGRPETFEVAGRPATALVFEFEAAPRNQDHHRRVYARRCAEQVARWLADEATGFRDTTQGFRRLKPADVAVLVYDGRQAAQVRRELARRGVDSVYLSERDSVFVSDEARDLLLWLRAIADPSHARAVRLALATSLAARTLPELHALATVDAVFEQACERLRESLQLWSRQGVLPMLRAWLFRWELPQRWLQADPASAAGVPGSSGASGERRLTNVLHLAELLQQASAGLDSRQALVRWLHAQIQADGTGADELIVRLESDADLVRVVTIHKSKGLEYPVVLLPFVSAPRPSPKKPAFVKRPGVDGQPELVFGPTEADLQAARQERLREELRLLYVALTRARHAAWVGVAPVKEGQRNTLTWHHTAIGYLLTGDREPTADDLPQALAQALSPLPHTALVQPEPTDPIGFTRVPPPADQPPLGPARAFHAVIDRGWWVASFSALVKAGPGHQEADLREAAVRQDEGDERDDPLSLSPSPAPPAPDLARAAAPAGHGSPQAEFDFDAVDAADALQEPAWHGFDRGAEPGNFLHDQLEWLAGECFALHTSAALREALAQRCVRAGRAAQAEMVVDWLREVVTKPLPPVGTSLSGLATLLPEMEFWFPAEGVSASAIDRLCQLHLLHGEPRERLPARELRGLLKGFADLVFEHGGRYWVLDYKGNHLGDDTASYGPAALRRAMAAHRYDVQAALYLLALHRLLRQRLGPTYDPQQHLGGAVYCFLRGVQHPETAGCCHLRADLVWLDTLDGLMQGQAPAAELAAEHSMAPR